MAPVLLNFYQHGLFFATMYSKLTLNSYRDIGFCIHTFFCCFMAKVTIIIDENNSLENCVYQFLNSECLGHTISSNFEVLKNDNLYFELCQLNNTTLYQILLSLWNRDVFTDTLKKLPKYAIKLHQN